MSNLESRLGRAEEWQGEFVARHRKGRTTEELEAYADDPVGFGRDVLKCSRFAAKQIEQMLAVRDHALVAVQSCNMFGKDHAAAHLALWWAYCRRGLVLITSASERQVKEVSMGEIRRAWLRAGNLPGELYEMTLRLDRSEQAGILAFTAADVSRIAGLHAPRVMAILSEAQGLEPWAYEGMLGCAVSEDSRVLAIGNPLVPSGRFFEICRSPHWHHIKLSAFDHENLIEGREIIPGAVTQRFVDTMAQEYGTDSGIYAARVLGEFPVNASDALAQRSWLDAAVDRWDSKTFYREMWSGDVVAAVDPAHMGPDFTALAIRQGPVLREPVVTWAKLDTMQTCGRLAEELDRRHLTPLFLAADDTVEAIGRQAVFDRVRLIVDAVGVGAGVMDRLRELRWSVKDYNGAWAPGTTHPSDEAKRPWHAVTFANRRAESYFGLRRLLETNAIALPRDEVLFEELTTLRWGLTSAGKILIEPKDDFRQRMGRSCDRADAVAMAFHGVYRPFPRMTIGSSFITL